MNQINHSYMQGHAHNMCVNNVMGMMMMCNRPNRM